METSLNTMMRLVSGKRFYGDDCDVSDVEKAKEFRGILREMVSLAGVNNRGDFLPFLRWFDLDNLEKRLKNIGKRIDAFLQSLIDEIRASNKTTNTMISQLLVQQRTQPEQYSDQIIKGLCMVIIFVHANHYFIFESDKLIIEINYCYYFCRVCYLQEQIRQL